MSLKRYGGLVTHLPSSSRASTGLCALLLVALGAPAAAQAHVRSWGASVSNSSWHEQGFVEIAAGGGHTVALRSDGSIAAWGSNHGDAYNRRTGGQCDGVVPL